jgi:SAM-dependent methyltransferase
LDAEAWDERYAAAPLLWSAGPNQFVATLADLPPGRAVDVACGEGRNAIWLASLGWSVTAVDFSGVAIDKAHRLDDERRVEWVVGDVLTWSPRSTYDLAVLAYLQVDAPARRSVVRRAWSWLDPGGHLFVVAHDTSNIAEGYGGPQDASVLFTADDVLGDLAGEPLDVVCAERVERVVPDADRPALDALVHLVKPRSAASHS